MSKNKETKPGCCSVCGAEIKTMSFKGTGVCSENHRKQRDGETPEVRSQMDAGITQMNMGATQGGINPGGIR